jgi:hypothetical protein
MQKLTSLLLRGFATDVGDLLSFSPKNARAKLSGLF